VRTTKQEDIADFELIHDWRCGTVMLLKAADRGQPGHRKRPVLAAAGPFFPFPTKVLIHGAWNGSTVLFCRFPGLSLKTVVPLVRFPPVDPPSGQ
jgi:hypothetical protein